MKKLENTLKMLTLLLIVAFTACKKNNNETKPEPKPITEDELVGYQLAVAFSSPAHNVPPRLFHFAKVGDEVIATMDGVQSRRARSVKVTDNRFTFDSDGDGKIVYEFNLIRNEKGIVTMGSYKYQNTNDPAITMSYAVISPNDFPSVKGKTFTSANNNYGLKFTEDTWTFTAVAGKTGIFYEIAKGAWKGRLDNLDYMGFYLLLDNNQLGLFLIREGSEQTPVFQ